MLFRPAVRTGARALRRGFSLLEILVVVAIIVMLAGLGGYYVVQRYEDAKLSAAKIQANTLSEQAEIFYTANGRYPTIQELAQPQPNGGGPLVGPDKLRDPWGREFVIEGPGPKNGMNKADVYTTSPRGQLIGNFPNQ